MHRLYQIVLIGLTLFGSWFGMQAVHELGHVIGAWLTGGRVERVVLHPLTISRTDLTENPQPLVVAWAGPMFGALAPLALWGVIAVCSRVAVGRAANHCGARFSVAITWLVRFFSGFCLIANGLYIGLGSFGRIGDCGDMLQHGAHLWQLWLFGAITAPLGLFVWHRLGPQLRFASSLDNHPVSDDI